LSTRWRNENEGKAGNYDGLTRRELEYTIAPLLQIVRLNPADVEKYSGDFSDGQNQRVAFVCALALKAELIAGADLVSAWTSEFRPKF
jgi:ABC-type oligopeptide transport system ATPase subunit